ncbi:MAG TPA: hypothetical protein VNZ52_04665 [Candidatus Thermoplasmatota archaeon]|nr:hypothetical protein [Candidatus Thermoplasmatota archaeon]
MRKIENADQIDDKERKEKGELNAAEHNRLNDLQASRGPTENTHKGAQKTGPRNNK